LNCSGDALWVTLKHLLRRNHAELSPVRALALLSTFESADIVLPTTDGREIRLRRVSTPSREQQQLLDQLGIPIPERLNLNFECSADPAIVRSDSKTLSPVPPLFVTNFG